MRKTITILALGIAVAAIASINELKWTATTIDLGEIKAGEIQELVFEFENTSSLPITILDAKGSCGCTNVSYPKEPILPGSKAVLTANYRSSTLGSFHKSIRITSSDKKGLTLLYFKGQTIKKADEI